LSLEDNAACSVGFGVAAENDSKGETNEI